MIRAATYDDIDRLVEMGKVFFEYTGYSKHGLRYDPQCAAQTMAMLVGSPAHVFLVAEVDGKVEGSAAAVAAPWHLDFRQVVYTEVWWWMNPEKRKTGVAREMLQEMEKGVTDRGGAVLQMAAINNMFVEQLGNFYEKNGYDKADSYWKKRLSG